MSMSDTRLCFGLTEAGKTILRGIGFIALAAFAVPAFGVLSALVSVILTGVIVGFMLRPKIRLTGNLPDRIVVNRAVQLKYLISNIGRFPAYNLFVKFDALPETIEQIEGQRLIPRLGSGETKEVTVTIMPRRRGHYRIKHPVCRSNFPFKLFNFGCSYDEQESLIVLPSFSLLRNPPRHLMPKTGFDSYMFANRMGAFPEYMGNRPFLPGDSRRRIDVRAWARLAMPATKQYSENLDNSTALVLDTGVPEGASALKSNESEEFEAAVSLCASMAFTINDNCLIDLMLAGPDLYQFINWRRKMRLDKIHEILAGVELSSDYTPERMMQTLANHLDQMSEVVFILTGWKKTYRQLLELAGRARCNSTVFIIGKAGKIDLERYGAIRAENINILTPEEILTEQVMYL